MRNILEAFTGESEQSRKNRVIAVLNNLPDNPTAADAKRYQLTNDDIVLAAKTLIPKLDVPNSQKLMRLCATPEVLRRLPVEEVTAASPWVDTINWHEYALDLQEQLHPIESTEVEQRTADLVRALQTGLPTIVYGQQDHKTDAGKAHRLFAKKSGIRTRDMTYGEGQVDLDALTPGWQNFLAHETRVAANPDDVFDTANIFESAGRSNGTMRRVHAGRQTTFAKGAREQRNSDAPYILVQSVDIAFPEMITRADELAVNAQQQIVRRITATPGKRYKALALHVGTKGMRDPRGSAMSFVTLIDASEGADLGVLGRGKRTLYKDTLQALRTDPGTYIKALHRFIPEAFNDLDKEARQYSEPYFDPKEGRQYEVHIDVPELAALGDPDIRTFTYSP